MGDVLALLNISINAALRTAKRLQGRKYKGKFISARRRRNAGEGAAGLSNQHASGVRSPEFPLRQRPQHQSMSWRMGHITNGAFLFVQQKRVALRFPPLSR